MVTSRFMNMHLCMWMSVCLPVRSQRKADICHVEAGQNEQNGSEGGGGFCNYAEKTTKKRHRK